MPKGYELKEEYRKWDSIPHKRVKELK